MIVAVSRRAFQDACNQTKSSLTIRCLLDGSFDLSGSGRLGSALFSFAASQLHAFGSQSLLDLVRVKGDGLLSMCLVDVFERCTRRDAEDIVKGRSGISFVGRDFIADAEDLTI